MLFKKIIVISFAFILFSCNEEKEINPDYLSVYKDILIVGSSTSDSLSAAKKRDSVFKSYGIDEAKFREWTIEEAKNRDIYIKTIDSLRNSILIYQKQLELNKKED